MRSEINRTCLALMVVALTGSLAFAQSDTKTTVVIDGLYNPCGVTIQPGTGQVFVADSGAGRVVRVVDGKAQDVITGFPKDVYGKGPKFDIGPLGMVFLDQSTLVVGGGGEPDGKELLRVYKIPGPGAAAINAKDMVESFALAATDEIKGEGNFYGLAATRNAVFVTCNGDDTKGWVSRAMVKGTKVGPYSRFIPTKEAIELDAPVAITISPDGHVVVGQMGEITVPKDGMLTFYDAKSGKMLSNFATGLSDITGLAYSPKGMLYATDFSWADTKQGGLFRLDAKKDGNKQNVVATKVLSLDKPTCIAFASDGTMYVTVIGSDGDKPGKLLKIAPGL